MYSTIDEQIDDRPNRRYRDGNTHYLSTIPGARNRNNELLVIKLSSVVDKHRALLMEHTTYVRLSEAEYTKYMYHPRMYCANVHGDVDLWSTLLRINNMATSSDFTKKIFIDFLPSFFEVLNSILAFEEEQMMQNYMEDVHDKIR